MALMVSADTCMQVVQGSNPTDGWKVIGNATAFSAVAFKMILRAPVWVPVHFFLKILFNKIRRTCTDQMLQGEIYRCCNETGLIGANG